MGNRFDKGIEMSYSWVRGLCTAALTAAIATGPAMADGMARGSMKDAAPADPGRKLEWSWNIGATSDYIFRGISQNARKPTVQGGLDVTYGLFYAGVWGSGLNFGTNTDGSSQAHTEIDVYAGIKPKWGPVTFDFGVIYYIYPGARDAGAARNQVGELDYVEGKVGASVSLVPNLTTGVTVFWSPEYTGKQGSVTTVEGTASYELPKIGRIVPTIGGTLGSSFGDARDASSPFTAANGKDSYLYWNAGLTLGLDKLSIDFRYWDTDIPNTGTNTNWCTGKVFGCDEVFVATAKVTF